ncbi:endolytic transglycosylase MltG [Ovoidimarina sediminis]|uniref:endolytic transglycosylase MltG n=1 Tax=Ovoidimarina sediminis TaxID=3079856 RepID=UPI00290ADCCA|nr:endolytic transglycosylase MltG [Rhodophyticola sp. MJ-SS7]MDU8945705.1 endolytic transglycosylase MltG [Rhodophyticola sp. MJ-SS7]
MWKHFVANVLTVLIVGLIALGGFIAWAQRQYVAEGPLDAAICVQVEPGTTMRRVSANLEEQGAISNGSIFRVGTDYTGKASELKAGSFLVPPRSSMADIVDILTRGGRSTCGTEVVYRIGVNSELVQVRELDPSTNRFAIIAEFDPAPEEGAEEPEAEALATYEEIREAADTRYRVALAEGVTSWQVVEALKSADFLTGTVEDLPAEGTLAPDSYEVTAGSDIASLLAAMAERQAERLDAAWQNRASDLPISTPEEALILASIIEKETGQPEERGQVASVFVNRLRRGMRLQTDPTVIYGVTDGRGVLGRGIRQSELDRETPWNTYLIDGLPITPIANPGLASIEAALNPDETPYIFFVADGSGGHAFAETLAEHNENVARWREIEAERQEN